MNRETVIKITAVVAIAALMFSLILVFNGMIGYAADDYLYFFKYTGHVVKGTPERLTGIRDIFTGMVTHYKICNGRIPAHFLLHHGSGKRKSAAARAGRQLLPIQTP